MMVLVLEKAPPSLRGELTRWLLEPRTGVFVGDVSAQVRELLWGMVEEKIRAGGAVLIHNADREQGFALRSLGDTTRALVDYGGLMLVRTPEKAKRKPVGD
jgi:CRISPR-associated protein Cas2